MTEFFKKSEGLRELFLGDAASHVGGRVGQPLPETAPNTISKMKARDKQSAAFEHLGGGLARKGGRIYARVHINGKLNWRSTKTNKLSQAQRWLERWNSEAWNERHGVETNGTTLKQKRVLVSPLINEYVEAGHPIIRKRALKPKSRRSVQNEKYYLKPTLEFFSKMEAANLGLADCDRYLKWRLAGGYITTSTIRGRQITRRSKGGTRAVDLELTFLSNALTLAVRRGHLKTNPLLDRGRYTDKDQIRHCRDVSPTPAELQQIVEWLSANDQQQYADFTQFLAYSGLRVGEGQKVEWGQVNWSESLIHVKRSKKGLVPFVPLLPEMRDLLERMKKHMTNARLIFPAPFLTDQPLNYSAYRRYLAKACVKLGIRHVTPHGLRSYFVTQARQSGLTDAEIAQLIGDKTGPSIIEQVYGDVRPDHLLAIARKIQLTASTRDVQANPSSEP